LRLPAGYIVHFTQTEALQLVLRSQEKGGKSREIPVRHDLEGFILAGDSLSPSAKKVLATLWRYQHQQFGNDNSKRWTFGVNPLFNGYPQYLAGVSEGVNRGWVAVSPEAYQCMLIHEGLAYLDDNDKLTNNKDFYVF
jgi:hypothetical protein